MRDVSTGRRGRGSAAPIAISLVALFIALGGSAFAAAQMIDGHTIKIASEPGNRLVAQSVTGKQVKAATLGTVPNAVHANTADHATTADNANSLGGIPSSHYTRNDCASETGQIKGFAYVPASPSFSSTFVDLPGAYNCSTEAVQARRLSTGEYEVVFQGSPSALAYGNAIGVGGGGPSLISIAFNRAGAGDFYVGEWNMPGADLFDAPFDIIVP